MISIRLDPETEQSLQRTAESYGVTKSEFLRTLIRERLSQESRQLTPWQLGCDRFGNEGSGHSDLSVMRKSKMKEKLRGKTGRH
jgi:hypothetical protein